jgi:hypothetical protein
METCIKKIRAMVAYGARLHACEDGLISISHLAVVLVAAILLAMLLNAVTIFSRKVERQTAADAVAQASGVIYARGLNEITATNHVIGEMTAVVIVHNAVAGPRPLADRQDTAEIDRKLDIAQRLAAALGAPTIAYPVVGRSPVMSSGMVGAAKKKLRQELTIVYFQMAAALSTTPPNIPAYVAALRREAEILKEFLGMMQWELRAAAQLPHVHELADVAIPNAKRHTDRLVEQVPLIARNAAEGIGRLNGLFTTVSSHSMPVMPDPLADADGLSPIASEWYASWSQPHSVLCPPELRVPITRKQVLKVTQLVRATFPWVIYHRQRPLNALQSFRISQAADLYYDFTLVHTEMICDDLQRKSGIRLYVVKNATLPDKGHERWSDDPAAADRLFAVIGVAWENAPRLLSLDSWFDRDHRHGQLAFAQALVYSANTQRRHAHRLDLSCKRIIPNRQSGTGWDTLAWSSEHVPPWEWIAKTDTGEPPSPEYPHAKVNWHAKLVPASIEMLRRLHDDRALPRQVRRVVDDMLITTPASLVTH